MAEVRVLPDALVLNVTYDSSGLADLASRVCAALQQAPLPPIVTWSVPATARRRAAKPGQLPAPLLQGSVPDATLALADGSLGTFFRPYGQEHWEFELGLRVSRDRPVSVPELLAAQRSVCRALLHEPAVERVRISIQGPGALCVPEVPIALMRTYIVSCRAAEVAMAYAHPEAFWHSGWSASEWIGDRALLERAMHAVDTVAFLQQVLGQQWALARAARPGLCHYYAPQVLPEESAHYRSGAPALSTVGYADAAATVELACALRPPAHVPGWEIFDLYHLLQVGALPDGRPVQGIRIVFLYQETAVAERRPLLDIGARVFYYDSDGHLRELVE